MHTKPRICITTHFDAEYQSVGELCLVSLKKYGEQHDYDVVTIPEARSGRPASWDKILVVQELFRRGYEFVFWVDADAVIVRYDKDIADEIQEDKNLYMAQFSFPEGGEGFNFGVFLIRNCAWSVDFLEKIWGLTEYIFHPWWENAALFHVLQTTERLPTELRRMLLPPPQKGVQSALLSKITTLSNTWNYARYFSSGMLHTNPIIKHYPATKMYAREYLMTRDLARRGLVSQTRATNIFWKTVGAYGKEKSLSCLRFFKDTHATIRIIIEQHPLWPF